MIQITLSGAVNISLQIGDLVYVALHSGGGSSGLNNPSAGGNNTKPKVLGTCVGISGNSIIVDNTVSGITVGFLGNCVFMFEKDKRAGLSGIIGYYALTEYRNHSTTPVEMFATAVDYVESSK